MWRISAAFALVALAIGAECSPIAAQTVDQLYPKAAKPPPEIQCPPERPFLFMDSTFTEKQNFCLRAGRPFYLEAKHQFRVCQQQLLQCPRDLQVDVYVHQGMWVTVLKRVQGLLFISYESGGARQGYADPAELEAPHQNN